MVYFLLPFKQRAYIVCSRSSSLSVRNFFSKGKIWKYARILQNIKIVLLSTKCRLNLRSVKIFLFLEMPLVLVYHVGKISVQQNWDRHNISFNLNHWFGVSKSQLYIVLFFDCIFFNWDDPWLTTILYNTGWQANFFNWRTLKNSILIKQYPPRWKWADDCQYNSMREKEIVFSFYQYSRLKQNSTCSLNKMSISTYLSSIKLMHISMIKLSSCINVFTINWHVKLQLKKTKGILNDSMKYLDINQTFGVDKTSNVTCNLEIKEILEGSLIVIFISQKNSKHCLLYYV